MSMFPKVVNFVRGERTFLPSTSNLCWRIHMSRSPSPYCILSSRVAHSVSRGFPRAEMGVLENNPSHFIPEMIRCFSSVEGNLVLEEIAQIRSLSNQSKLVIREILFLGGFTSQDFGECIFPCKFRSKGQKVPWFVRQKADID